MRLNIYMYHAHAHNNKHMLYVAIACMIAILLFFYYGIKFADSSYNRVLGAVSPVADPNMTRTDSIDKFGIYIFFILLIIIFTFFTYFAYRIFVKQYHDIDNESSKRKPVTKYRKKQKSQK